MDLSVIIPVYNGENTLTDTLTSLLNQENTDFLWEVVAVDDGSSDQSLALLSRFVPLFEKRGVPLRIHTGPNRGVAHARNLGLSEAKGEFLLYLDADDQYTPDALSLLIRTAREKSLSLLVFDAEYLYEDGTRAPFAVSRHPGGYMEPSESMLVEPAPWNRLIRKTLFTENGLTFLPGIWYEDLSVIPALGKNLKETDVFYLKKPLYLYYQSPGSITRSAYSPKRMDVFPALLHLKENAKERPEEVEYLAFYHLYHSFVWIFWQAGKTDQIRRAGAFMREHFPHWRKNPLIRRRHSRKELLVAGLFYYNLFFVIRLWKGKKL